MIGIVGGGISGLLVARDLERRGLDWILFEAEDRVGGVMRSGRVDGRVLDWGPQRTRLVGPVRELVNELGVQDRVVEAPDGLDLMVYRDGRLRRVPFGVGDFLRSDIVGFGSKVRMLLEPLTGGSRRGERVDEYFRRKFGEETYRTVLGPLYGGLYASDPRDMEAGRMLVPMLEQSGIRRSLVLSLLRKGGRVSPPAACSFDEGMQVMPQALAESLGDRVRLSDGGRRLHRSGSSWTLETEGGTHHLTDVVVCLPARAAARLLAESAPEPAERIASLRYNPLAVVHLECPAKLNGMGFQVAFGEGLALKGVTYNHALFGREDVYTAYLGGAQRPDVVDLADGALVELARREFASVTGAEATRALDVTRIGMPAWDRSWRALDGLELPDGLHLATNWESRPGLPGRFTRARRVGDEIVARGKATVARRNAAA